MNLNPRVGGNRRRKKKGQRTLDLPSQLVEELKSEAARLGRPLSSLVQMAWRISRGRPADPPRVPQPWERVASELELRLSSATKRRCASRAWLQFEAWCAERELSACPALNETLLAYAEACLASGANLNEVLRAVAAVAIVHRTRGHKIPRLRPNARAVIESLEAILGHDMARQNRA